MFTLGEGHYTEHDIAEGARAFTGWSLDRIETWMAETSRALLLPPDSPS